MSATCRPSRLVCPDANKHSLRSHSAPTMSPSCFPRRTSCPRRQHMRSHPRRRSFSVPPRRVLRQSRHLARPTMAHSVVPGATGPSRPGQLDSDSSIHRSTRLTHSGLASELVSSSLGFRASVIAHFRVQRHIDSIIETRYLILPAHACGSPEPIMGLSGVSG